MYSGIFANKFPGGDGPDVFRIPVDPVDWRAEFIAEEQTTRALRQDIDGLKIGLCATVAGCLGLAVLCVMLWWEQG